MATTTLYFASSVSGTVTTPANALGAPNGVFTGDVNVATNWTHRWRFTAQSGTAQNTQTLTLRVRKGSNSGNPSISAARLYKDGVLVSTLTVPANSITATATTGQDVTITFAGSVLGALTGSTVDIEIDAASAAGGATVRNTVQLDSVTWAVDYVTGTVVEADSGSSGSAAFSAAGSAIDLADFNSVAAASLLLDAEEVYVDRIASFGDVLSHEINAVDLNGDPWDGKNYGDADITSAALAAASFTSGATIGVSAASSGAATTSPVSGQTIGVSAASSGSATTAVSSAIARTTTMSSQGAAALSLDGLTSVITRIDADMTSVGAAQTTFLPARFLRPNSNITQTGFTNGYLQIDEATPSDADFAWGANNTAAVLEVGLEDPSPAPTEGISTISYRVAKTAAGVLSASGNAVTMTVQLVQGTTILATDTVRTLSGTWTTYTWDVDTIVVTNWADLRLRFTTSASGGTTNQQRGGAVSWATIDIPTPIGPAYAEANMGTAASAATAFDATVVTVRTADANATASAATSLVSGRTIGVNAASTAIASMSLVSGRTVGVNAASAATASLSITSGRTVGVVANSAGQAATSLTSGRTVGVSAASTNGVTIQVTTAQVLGTNLISDDSFAELTLVTFEGQEGDLNAIGVATVTPKAAIVRASSMGVAASASVQFGGSRFVIASVSSTGQAAVTLQALRIGASQTSIAGTAQTLPSGTSVVPARAATTSAAFASWLGDAVADARMASVALAAVTARAGTYATTRSSSSGTASATAISGALAQSGVNYAGSGLFAPKLVVVRPGALAVETDTDLELEALSVVQQLDVSDALARPAELRGMARGPGDTEMDVPGRETMLRDAEERGMVVT